VRVDRGHVGIALPDLNFPNEEASPQNQIQEDIRAELIGEGFLARIK
jgi:hypothetical protein